MSIYDQSGYLKLSPSQIRTLLDVCAYKWYLSKIKGFVDISLIDTAFPGRVVHTIGEVALVKKWIRDEFFDPESEEFKQIVHDIFYNEISKGYRIKRAMEKKYQERIEFEYPDITGKREQHKKLCEVLEKDILDSTLKYCKIFIKDVLPLMKPEFDEEGNIKKEIWCEIKLEKLKVNLRMRIDLMEEKNLISDNKVLSPNICPGRDPKKHPVDDLIKYPKKDQIEDLIKDRGYMFKQEQYMYYSMYYWRKYGIIPTNRQYTIKKNKTPFYVPLPDVNYNENHFQVIMEKVKAAKKVIESETFHGSNQGLLCSEDYCGFYPKCKYVLRPY